MEARYGLSTAATITTEEGAFLLSYLDERCDRRPLSAGVDVHIGYCLPRISKSQPRVSATPFIERRTNR